MENKITLEEIMLKKVVMENKINEAVMLFMGETNLIVGNIKITMASVQGQVIDSNCSVDVKLPS